MTRTIAIGSVSDRQREVYDVVRHAQALAVKEARAGMRAEELDAVARDVIVEAGYGSYFTHSLGHGVGLEIHEWPRMAKGQREVLPENAVVTIEPGIYLPGECGVRIEDIVRLHAGGAERLTHTPTDLRIL